MSHDRGCHVCFEDTRTFCGDKRCPYEPNPPGPSWVDKLKPAKQFLEERGMMQNKPMSELYLEAAEQWTDLESAAQILEDTKSIIFSQYTLKQTATSVAKAELLTRAMPEWEAHVKKIVDARTQANKAKVKVEYWKMRGWEESSRAADNRLQAKI